MRVTLKISDWMDRFSLGKILVLAILVRALWYLFILLTHAEGFWLYDSHGYWNIAYNLHEYGIFSRDAEPPILPDYFRTPLYPLFIYPTIGFDPEGYSIPFFQVIIDCFTCLLIYRLILLSGGKPAHAKLAALIYALHIPAIVMSNFVITESIFAFLICLFVYRYIHLTQNLNYKNAVLAGLTGGLCVMCKPLGFILIFPAGIFLLFQHRIKLKTALTLITLIISFYAIQFPWMARNKNVYGRYFNSVLGEHLLLGYHASNVYSKANDISFHEAQDILREKFVTKINYDPYKHPYEYAKLIERESYRIFLSNKTIFIKEHLKECFKFFVQPLRGYVQHQLGKKSYTSFISSLFVIIQLTELALLYLLIAIAFIFHWQKKLHLTWIFLLLLIIIGIFSQFNTMPFTDARMRFPMDPLIISLAVLCFDKLVEYSRNKRSKSAL